MKKTIALTHPKHKTERWVELVKHDIKKYLNRERRKALPVGMDYWTFDCRFGTTEEEATKVFTSEINKHIDAAAAQQLGVTPPAVSRRLAALEARLGVRLFQRSTRSLTLTEAGQLYYERSQRIVQEARLAHEQLGELLAQPSGVLRASLPVDFASTYLAPLIAEFARAHPGISFEFDLTPRRVDLVSEPFDVAIRMGPPKDQSLIARPIATLGTVLVVGLVISLFQALTQINESTLSFVPKLIAAVAVFALAGPWMLTTLVEFIRRTLLSIPDFAV